MKIIHLLFTLFPLLSFCTDQPVSTEKEGRIAFLKEIIIDYELNASTTYFSKLDSHLLIYDGHVSNRKLICIDIITAETEWIMDKSVFQFYTYKNNIVIDFDSYIAVHEIKTGNQIWRTQSGNIDYSNKLRKKVSQNLLINYEGKSAILNLDERTIDTSKNDIVSAQYFKMLNQQVESYVIGIENNYKIKGQLLSMIVVENEHGLKNSFIWSLDKENRMFYLDCYNETKVKMNSVNWQMDEEKPKNTSIDYFNGYPEPEKLNREIHLINDKIFLYENYTAYRWSWGHGSNRISCINPEKGNIIYQKWGHAPSNNKYLTAKRFHFFHHNILYADNIMHFQNGNGKFWTFNEESGEIIDSLKIRNTLFRNYDRHHLVGFTYERKWVAESEYTNALELRFWDTEDNTFTETSRFDYNNDYPYEPTVYPNLGLIVLSVYKESTKRSVIHVYKIEAAGVLKKK